MNSIFICVIVLDKMCFHILNLCWFKRKKIFECFRCFWKVFWFYKNWKFQKTVLPCFGDSVAGHPSRMPQSRAEPWKSLCTPRDWTFHSRTSRQNRPASSRLWHATWMARDWVAKTGQHCFWNFSVFEKQSTFQKHLKH